jgi:hypothetical protein
VSAIFTWSWLVWIGLFVAIEGLAFAMHGKGFTLSEHVWKWFSIPDANDRHNNAIRNPQPVTWLIRLRRFALLAFLAWLSLHFLTGGRF